MKYNVSKFKITDFSTPKELTYVERVCRDALINADWKPITAKEVNSYIQLHAVSPATQKHMIQMGTTYQHIFGDTVTSLKAV